MNEPTLTIDATKASAKVSPMHYGLMTEEINHCYEGGLYAELAQNRAFLDDPETPVHWSVVQSGGSAAAMALDPAQPLNDNLPTSLRLDIGKASKESPAGIANDGFWGIPVHPRTRYRASFHAKAAPGFTGTVTVSIRSEDGDVVYAEAAVPALTSDWNQYGLTLETGDVTPTASARYVLTVDQPGTVWFSLVSLFPPTWNDRPNGMRRDLMQMMVDMKPKFLRFPGGNYLEGDYIETRFKWKETLGPLAERPGHPCPWGYRSNDGVGLLEFLLWCEDIGAEPLLGIYAGYSLKKDYIKPGPDLEPFIEEALEEIEYIIGDTSTKWGARRAQDGHPEPFKMTYVEIGNEDWFDESLSYDGRYAQFHDALKAKYPQLKLVSSIGFEHDRAKLVHSRQPDVVDEHYYFSTDEFVGKSPGFYEKYDRNGPEIFVGEWAAHEDREIRPWGPEAKKLGTTPSMKAALGDGVFMAAMERNSDIVTLQCYAPLFVNVNPGAWQWRPNLIGFDALSAFGSPSYHAFCMFSRNVGDEILKSTPADTPVQASVTRESETGRIIVKLVNPEPEAQSLKIALQGVASVAPTADVETLSADPEVVNSIAEPRKAAPVRSQISGVAPSFAYTVPANAIVVLTLHP